MSGVKRPAESEGTGADLVARPAQQPRLELEVSEEPNADEQAEGISTDLICQIASFMDTGDTLMNVCVAVGPEDTGKVRYEYLKDNDEYVVRSLQEMQISESDFGDWRSFRANLPKFDKCKQNMEAWMEINDDWKTRCTSERMQELRPAFRHLRTDANIIFNNPAVALEIGLLDVLCFLVEEKDIDANTAVWRGFVSRSLIRIGLSRGDPELLGYLMSSNRFDLKKHRMFATLGVSDEQGIVRYAMACHNFVDLPCFEVFIRHPKVNLNSGGYEGPLHVLLARLHGDMMNGTCYQRRLARIYALLDAGADPHFATGNEEAPIAYAIGIFNRRDYPEKTIWKDLVQKMESVGNE